MTEVIEDHIRLHVVDPTTDTERSRGADELIDEAVDHLIAYDEWLERKMRPRIEALERGEPTISDDEVRAWLERQNERERQERS